MLRWFYLGVSIGPLLQLQSGPPFVKAVSLPVQKRPYGRPPPARMAPRPSEQVLQLLEEFQYHFARSTVQNMKIIKAKHSRRGGLQAGGAGGGSDDDLKPSLQRQNGEVLYAYLLTPHIAHPLSASQVRRGMAGTGQGQGRRASEGGRPGCGMP